MALRKRAIGGCQRYGQRRLRCMQAIFNNTTTISVSAFLLSSCCRDAGHSLARAKQKRDVLIAPVNEIRSDA
jgi:hypothetical protein